LKFEGDKVKGREKEQRRQCGSSKDDTFFVGLREEKKRVGVMKMNEKLLSKKGEIRGIVGII